MQKISKNCTIERHQLRGDELHVTGSDCSNSAINTENLQLTNYFSDVGEEVTTAAKNVAETLKGDKDRILMDLLQKFKNQARSKDMALHSSPAEIMYVIT